MPPVILPVVAMSCAAKSGLILLPAIAAPVLMLSLTIVAVAILADVTALAARSIVSTVPSVISAESIELFGNVKAPVPVISKFLTPMSTVRSSVNAWSVLDKDVSAAALAQFNTPLSLVCNTWPEVPASAGKVNVTSFASAGDCKVILLVPSSPSSYSSNWPAEVEPFFTARLALAATKPLAVTVLPLIAAPVILLVVTMACAAKSGLIERLPLDARLSKSTQVPAALRYSSLPVSETLIPGSTALTPSHMIAG